MLDTLSPARRRFVLVVVGALLLAVVAAVAAAVLRARADRVVPVSQAEEGPVLLVSGYGGSTASLTPLRDALRRAGRDVVVVPAVGGGTGDLDDQAEALDGAADAAMRTYDAGSVDVVGYSAGGVVARLWVRSHGGGSKARRVVSIGSPQHGTTVAELAAGVAGCLTACEQLAPDSALLRRLDAGDETPRGPRWFSIWSESDRTVVPTSSARLAGADNTPLQSLCRTDRTSHGGLPRSGLVQSLVTSALGADDLSSVLCAG